MLIENVLTVSAHVTREFSPDVECPASMADICIMRSLKGCFTSIQYKNENRSLKKCVKKILGWIGHPPSQKNVCETSIFEGAILQ